MCIPTSSPKMYPDNSFTRTSESHSKGRNTVIDKTLFILMRGFISSTAKGSFTTCRDAFLFSMVNPYGLGPTKLGLTSDRQQNAIYCHSSYGPSFGGGSDLRITHDANRGASSYSRLGNTYKCPPGQEYTFFTGVEKFTVTDYEVFGLYT